ncbi:MAG: hypothetical protein HZT40_19520 [Candidatus Thiothrix singaporensis]|uniref:Uncharacterized protein n=1 Tax=Candidatus Thiothrix singaporensis TaxID=2799669 RepID=A0A7L6AWU3_9GAMM|nr:MAG: hypothetical protein HZT40_19520 [Candidatus Thiothrix singaporensis]
MLRSAVTVTGVGGSPSHAFTAPFSTLTTISTFTALTLSGNENSMYWESPPPLMDSTVVTQETLPSFDVWQSVDECIDLAQAETPNIRKIKKIGCIDLHMALKPPNKNKQ